MERKRVIEILRYYRNIDETIDLNRRIIKSLQDASIFMRCGGAHANAPQIDETVRIYESANKRLGNLKIEIAVELNRLPLRERKVIYEFYICNHRWEQISKQINYGVTVCKKIRNSGLDRLGEHFTRNKTILRHEYPK
jgi:hypothetical protein